METLPTRKETKSLILPSWCNQIRRDKFHERFVITGGLGSGKTTNGLATWILNILENPRSKRWWVVAPTHARIQDAILPAALFCMSEMFGMIEDLHYRVIYSAPAKIVILSTRQEISFHSGERPDRMTSATIGGYYITEPGVMKAEVIEKCEDRCRDVRVEKKTMGIVEGTPEGDNHYMWNYNIDKSDPERKLRRFILHTIDNAHNLVAGYVERLMRQYSYSVAKQQAYLFGRFMAFNVGDVYPQFLEHRNVIPDIEADPYREVYVCFDFNARPLTWTAWQLVPIRVGQNVRMREVCIHESSLDCTSLAQAAVEFALAFPPEEFRDTPIEIWGDRTGHSDSHKMDGTDFTELERLFTSEGHYRNVSVEAPGAITPLTGSIAVTNQLFLYELLLVCERCKNLRRAYNMTRWKSGKAKLDKPPKEDHTHHGDGPRYRHWWVYRDFDPEGLSAQRLVTGYNPV